MSDNGLMFPLLIVFRRCCAVDTNRFVVKELLLVQVLWLSRSVPWKVEASARARWGE